mgnify:FL=1
MLGIHPLWLDSTTPAELVGLRELAESLLDDPHFIGLGEVGLDGFEPGLDQHKAEQVFLEELKIARDLDLPLSIHVRRTASKTLGLLRRVYGSPGKTGFQPVRGAVHAFNGSDAEREAFLAFGLVLGFGGACTYDGSKRIRRHLSELADGAWVLETDAPDMPPSSRRDAFALGHSTLDTRPADILEAARTAAQLRGTTLAAAAASARAAAIAAFPRLETLLRLPESFGRQTE